MAFVLPFLTVTVAQIVQHRWRKPTVWHDSRKRVSPHQFEVSGRLAMCSPQLVDDSMMLAAPSLSHGASLLCARGVRFADFSFTGISGTIPPLFPTGKLTWCENSIVLPMFSYCWTHTQVTQRHFLRLVCHLTVC